MDTDKSVKIVFILIKLCLKKIELEKHAVFTNCASYAVLKMCADSKKWVELNLKDVARVILCALLEKVRWLKKGRLNLKRAPTWSRKELELEKSANLKSKRVRQLEKVRLLQKVYVLLWLQKVPTCTCTFCSCVSTQSHEGVLGQIVGRVVLCAQTCAQTCEEQLPLFGRRETDDDMWYFLIS